MILIEAVVIIVIGIRLTNVVIALRRVKHSQFKTIKEQEVGKRKRVKIVDLESSSFELEFVWGSSLIQQLDPFVKCCDFRLETPQLLATGLWDGSSVLRCERVGECLRE